MKIRWAEPPKWYHKIMSHEHICTQIDKCTDKQLQFDDEAYGTHEPASAGAAVQLEVDRIDCNSEGGNTNGQQGNSTC